MTETRTPLGIDRIYTNFTRRFRRYKRSREGGVVQKGQRVYSLPQPNWIEGLIHPLAKRLAKQMGMAWESGGPAGLTSAVFVTFYPHGEDRSSDNAVHMTFEPGDFFGGKRAYLLVRDYKSPTDPAYKPGTIGYLNGMQFPTVQVPEDADLEWFKPYMG